MKRLALVFTFVLVFIVAHPVAGQFLQPGQTYVYEFSSVPLLERTSTAPLGSASGYFFLVPILEQGHEFRLELFENNLSDTPFCVQEVDSTRDPFQVGCQLPNVWQDLQGTVRISMEAGAGPMEISSAGLQVYVPTGSGDFFRYEQNAITFVAVPEPCTTTLLAFAIIFVLRRNWKSFF